MIAGLLQLPEITATLAHQGQQVEVTRGSTAFVERPPEQQGGKQQPPFWPPEPPHWQPRPFS